MSESRAGYLPELSYGSHIFQDLVESDILYAVVFEKKTLVFAPEVEGDGKPFDRVLSGRRRTEGNLGNLFSVRQREFCVSRYKDRALALSDGELGHLFFDNEKLW